MTPGEAVPRDESEAVTITFRIPGETDDRESVVRRGFVGTLPLIETGISASYEGRRAYFLDITG